MKIVIIGFIILFMASFAVADEAMDNDDQDYESFFGEMVLLTSEQWQIIKRHWVDGCQVTIELDESFEATDTGCQFFGQMVLDILSQGHCLVYVIPDEYGWVPSAENPIDLAWAKCLADESYCPQSTEADIGFDPTRGDTRPVFEPDPIYPSKPTPVVVTNKDDSGGGGGCFIQSTF
jgi:hypothetical protein